ncbi:MAG: glycosyltransferase, partial [Chitinophagaceae bacterium]|nr:glycosyltransferase [Chitinophagaceae bacterium]
MRNEGNPLISVCIINYNQGRFFADALNSYLSQTYKELELIVIDDCSTDNSVEVINRLLNEKN